MAKKKEEFYDVTCGECQSFMEYNDRDYKGDTFWGMCWISGRGMLKRWSCKDGKKKASDPKSDAIQIKQN